MFQCSPTMRDTSFTMFRSLVFIFRLKSAFLLSWEYFFCSVDDVWLCRCPVLSAHWHSPQMHIHAFSIFSWMRTVNVAKTQTHKRIIKIETAAILKPSSIQYICRQFFFTHWAMHIIHNLMIWKMKYELFDCRKMEKTKIFISSRLFAKIRYVHSTEQMFSNFNSTWPAINFE